MSTTADNKTTEAKTVSDVFSSGKVIRARSEKFGAHIILCIRCPGSSRDEKLRALTIDNFPALGEALYYSSFSQDVVEREWPDLMHYIKDKS